MAFTPKTSDREETGVGSLIDQQDKNLFNYPKTKKKKWEDDYKRGTFYIQNDVLEELNYRSGTEKGEKTRIVNEALQEYFRKHK